jgi:hypothetical protein
VCSIQYFTFGTQDNILFITGKLSKACHDPRIKDFKALMWLFGYLRKYYSDYCVKFYLDVTQSPRCQIMKTHKVPISELVVYTDAPSWQNCPYMG